MKAYLLGFALGIFLVFGSCAVVQCDPDAIKYESQRHFNDGIKKIERGTTVPW